MPGEQQAEEGGSCLIAGVCSQGAMCGGNYRCCDGGVERCPRCAIYQLAHGGEGVVRRLCAHRVSNDAPERPQGAGPIPGALARQWRRGSWLPSLVGSTSCKPRFVFKDALFLSHDSFFFYSDAKFKPAAKHALTQHGGVRLTGP
jgi:hypothetical protein